MKKNKLYIILAVLAVIALFSFAALCNQCSAPVEDKVAVPAMEMVEEEYAGDEDDRDAEAPTIELEIYDGPDYSEPDNICYYRVEAIATGIPAPEIVFDDDNNVNLIGSGRVEVGIEVGDSYTLTATAKNSAGTAAVSIELVGDCG